MILLGSHVLRTLAGRSTPDTLIHDVLTHESLPALLFAAAKDTALHHSLMRALEHLVSHDGAEKEREAKRHAASNQTAASTGTAETAGEASKAKEHKDAIDAAAAAAAKEAEKKERTCSLIVDFLCVVDVCVCDSVAQS